MSVSIHNTRGGYNTKDADAVPGDVRDGKTFYNADGRQTGIWTPEIKEMEKSFSITIGESNGAVLTDSPMIAYLIHENKMYDVYITDRRSPGGNGTKFYFSSLNHEISAFTGITIDGSYHPLWVPGPGVIQAGYYIQFQSESNLNYAKFTVHITSSMIESFYGGIEYDEDDAVNYHGKMLMVHYV